MIWHELLAIVGDEPIFSSAVLLTGQRDPGKIRRQLNRWVHAGKVVSLRRGIYVLAEPYAKSRPHPFLSANRLKRASYVSLQSALSHYGMIPEHVPVTTSVTTGRPEELDTPLGRFSFRHVRRALFFGYQQFEVSPKQHVFLALPEKALLDLIYLTPGSDAPSYLRELRLDFPETFDWGQMEEMAARFQCRKVEHALRRLRELQSEEGGFRSL